MSSPAAAKLRAHIAFHGLVNEQPLFGMVTRKHVEALHTKAAAAIGRPSLTIKDLRHIAAIAWVTSGVRIDRLANARSGAAMPAAREA